MSLRSMIFRDRSSSGFFEDKYRTSDDPWNFASSAYEQRRYDAIIGALEGRRYARALEPGCSVGVLTERLAQICDRVHATDFSPSAVERARARCAHLPNVVISCEPLTASSAFNGYDLVILSEIGYYFGKREWQCVVESLVRATEPGTVVLASHWLGKSGDHRISGDCVHEVLVAEPELTCEHSERHEAFRLDRFVRA